LKLKAWIAVGLMVPLGMSAGSWFATAEAQTEADSVAAPAAEDPAARLEGLVEQVQAIQADTDRMKRFKFSGYVQLRWETAENSGDTVKVAGTTLTPANVERFYIRRARLKLTYDASPLSQAVVYIDGGSDRTIRLLEGYLALLDPWTTDHRHQFWAGQFNVPFGYEIERSSSLRELPERSRAENVLFPGERDRGLKVVMPLTDRLETVVAVINGGGISSADFPTTDPTAGKDWLARARWSQGVFDAAVSYYDGRQLVPLTGDDIEVDRTRLGADAQLYYELPTLGGGSLKGELYRGANVNADSVTALTVSSSVGRLLRPGADPGHFDTDFLGGYVMWVQNLGEKFQFAARAERFDPNTDLDHDQFERVSLAVHGFYDGFTRVTVSYDIPRTEVPAGAGYDDVPDNLWTVQFQHRF